GRDCRQAGQTDSPARRAGRGLLFSVPSREIHGCLLSLVAALPPCAIGVIRGWFFLPTVKRTKQQKLVPIDFLCRNLRLPPILTPAAPKIYGIDTVSQTGGRCNQRSQSQSPCAFVFRFYELPRDEARRSCGAVAANKTCPALPRPTTRVAFAARGAAT